MLDALWYDRDRWPRRPVWPRTLGIALLITLALWLAVETAKAGAAERDAEPPRVVIEKSHTTSSHSFSCGKDCVSSSTSDHYNLFAADGGTCEVDRRTWARVQRGQSWKCQQLFGWRD